ncbi:hypothetical protein ACFQY0_11870 [Haloferula chungangensis]|uniref:PH domain-containing protein n=1 Tax=Haloferula chungangensis TaxID=1048331 RepID=A0ABW2L662_9BACT
MPSERSSHPPPLRKYSGLMAVAEPHKELRFTRSAQAVPFWIGAAIFGIATIILLTVSFYRSDNPALPHPLWAAIPLVLTWLCVRIAIRCTKHAYLILSPLGVEVFPFFKPASGMQMIPWTQITEVEEGSHLITLHFSEDQSSGIHLSLSPIEKSKRPLLAKALTGRVNKTSL